MSVAVSTAAIAASNVAVVAANNARKTAECVAYMSGYTDAGASTEQKQYYASCVHHVYPSAEMPYSQVIAIKCAIVILLALFVLGVYKEYRSGTGWFRSSVLDCVMNGVIYVLFGAGAMIGIVLVVLGVAFVIGA